MPRWFARNPENGHVHRQNWTWQSSHALMLILEIPHLRAVKKFVAGKIHDLLPALTWGISITKWRCLLELPSQFLPVSHTVQHTCQGMGLKCPARPEGVPLLATLFAYCAPCWTRCVEVGTKLSIDDTRHQLHSFSTSIIWLLHLCGYNNSFKRHQRIASKPAHKLLLSFLSLYSFTTCNTIDTFCLTTQILIILSCVAFRQMELPIEMSCKKLFLLT